MESRLEMGWSPVRLDAKRVVTLHKVSGCNSGKIRGQSRPSETSFVQKDVVHLVTGKIDLPDSAPIVQAVEIQNLC